MSHRLYHTPGFVLDRRDLKETDSLLYILTRDFGLLVVHAKGLRQISSKLRYHTSLFAYGNFSLVRGREFWRLVGAEESGLFNFNKKQIEEYLIYVRILTVLKQFFHGEDDSQLLFDDLVRSFSFLVDSALDVEDYQNFECILVLRVLRYLGYLEEISELKPFVDFSDWQADIVGRMDDFRIPAISLINKSFAAASV